MLSVLSVRFSQRNFKALIATALQCKRHKSEINVIKSKVPDINIPNILLDEYVWSGLDKWHDKTALVCLETGRNYTYNEVYKKSRALARFLRRSLGLKIGDTVGIVLPNVPEYPIALLGAIQAGLKITTVNPIYTSEEIKKQFIDSDTKLVFTLNELCPVVQNAINSISNKKIPIISMKHQIDYKTPVDAIKFEEICDGDYKSTLDTAHHEDVLFLPYSSGTTGMPKGVELTHKNIVANLLQMADPIFKLTIDTTETQQDVVPVFLPMFHIYGLVVVFLNAFSLGCKLVTIPKFSSNAFIRLLKEHKPTLTFAVPPVVLMMLNNPNIHTKDLESTRHVVSAAAPLGAADIIRFAEKTKGKVQLLQVYGMTETSPITIWSTSVLKNGIKCGGSGLLVANTESKIVSVDDSTNTGLGANQSGELLIRGPQNMKGYHNNKQATDEVLIENGWLRTGDIAHYDEDEHFFVTDRLKELIKVKGFQVAPAELEAVLRDHPAVADAAVIGIPHPQYGEVPKGFIVLKKNASTSPDNIKEYVASKVANYKHLVGGVVMLDKIPKNTAGKLLRRQLKEM